MKVLKINKTEVEIDRNEVWLETGWWSKQELELILEEMKDDISRQTKKAR